MSETEPLFFGVPKEIAQAIEEYGDVIQRTYTNRIGSVPVRLSLERAEAFHRAMYLIAIAIKKDQL